MEVASIAGPVLMVAIMGFTLFNEPPKRIISREKNDEH
jgi:hypothetical protein